MPFDTLANEDDNLAVKDDINKVMKIVAVVVGILLLLIVGIVVYMYMKKKNSDIVEEDFDDSEHLDIINQKIQEKTYQKSLKNIDLKKTFYFQYYLKKLLEMSKKITTR